MLRKMLQIVSVMMCHPRRKRLSTKVFASIYNPDEDETKLLPIETEKEWRIIETILEELQNEAACEE